MSRSELDRLCSSLGVRAETTYGNDELDASDGYDDWRRTAHPWTVTLRYGRRRLTVPFWTGSAHTEDPTAADVLACLVSDARAGEQSFEEFCADFGYDSDSRQAHNTWKACSKLAPRVRRLLGDDFERFARAEH